VRAAQPIKNLSGAGFAFEDRVGAWAAAAMLAGRPALDPELGPPTRIDFQRDADGWRLDDLILTFDSASCCASVKSYPQIAAGRASKDFVSRAWEELLGTSGSGFDPDHDLVAMVTAPVDAHDRQHVQELIRLARARAPEELNEPIATGQLVGADKKTIWDSFALPSGLAGVDSEAETNRVSSSPGELLRRLRLVEADFEHSPSALLEQALGWCSQALVDPSEASALWESLLAVVSEHRTAGGTITGELIVARVRERFALRDHPDYQRDLRILDGLSQRNMEQVRDRLPGDLHIDRPALLTGLDQACADASLIAIVGPSGCGKTAIAKAWAASREDESVVWLRAEQIGTITGPGGGLNHSLLATLSAARRPTWVIVDGLDRSFSDNADSAVAELVTALEDGPTLPFALILTSQQQEWARIAERLAARDAIADWRLVAGESFSDQEIAVVLNAHPKLRDVAYRGRLSGVLRNPKVLDAILRAMLAGSLEQSVQLSGEESQFAAWFYERLACGTGRGRASRGALVMRLAEQQGDRLQSLTPLAELDPAGLDHLDDLDRDGVCDQSDGQVRFTHDLYGDWIRQQLLIAHDSDRAEYVGGRLTSPLWHRAVRLYALSLLDADDAGAWSREMRRLGGDELGQLHDLFLEAALFAAEPRPALERIWPLLTEDQGRLLRRLLDRFLHVATVPHPEAVEAISAVEGDLATHAAATQRIPHWPLWLPLLQTISDHAEDALHLASDLVARITDLWLRFTPDGLPLRDQAAAIAIANARAHLANDARAEEEAQARIWRAMLAAVSERRDDVAELSSALAPSGAEADSSNAIGAGSARRPRLNRAFAEVCLDSDALHPVIAADPALASEILLGVLAPRPPRTGFGMPGDELGIVNPVGWFIPLWTRGPFLAFLRAAPADAVAFTLRLLDAATQSWAQTRGDHDRVVELAIPAGDDFIRVRGDQQTLLWYRGESHVPSPLACALMALEKWLYDEIDAGHDVGPVVSELLNGTGSVAVIGLLIAVGCREPRLFAGPLLTLLAVPELYLWDTQAKLHRPQHLLIGLFREHAEFRRLAEEWFLLEHRERRLESLAQLLMLTSEPVASLLDEELPKWGDRASAEGEPAALRFLIARLDRANWSQVADEDGELRWEFDAPEDLRAESDATAAELDERAFWMMFPGQCRQILDGELELPAEKLETFWEEISPRVTETAPLDVTSDGVITTDDARCGFAAVLITRHRQWLSRHPEREEFCVGALLHAAAVERERRWFDDARNGTAWSWDAFCAEALPLVWAEQPRDPRFRQAIARLAFSLSYETIRRLFAACGSVRDKLGDDFGRLQHLAVDAARFRRAAEVARARGPAWAPDRAAMEERIGQFLERTLDPEVPEWAALAVPPEGSRQSWGELDTGYLQAAYAWMPPIDQARDAVERAAWVAHWRESVIELVERVRRNHDRTEDEFDGGPQQDDLDLLRALPVRIIEMTAEEARPVWEPVLELGAIAPVWVDSYLSTWFIVGMQEEPAPEGYLAKWEEMLDYVESESARGIPQRRFLSTELNHLLLGLSGISIELWTAEHAHVAARLARHYERWAQANLSRRDDAARFASFLRRDGAAPLLSNGLVWLAAADTPPSSWHRDDLYEDAVGSLLDAVARHRQEITRSTGPEGDAYRTLLARLADRQVPIARELISRMSAAPGS
jgi:hypothetical protein